MKHGWDNISIRMIKLCGNYSTSIKVNFPICFNQFVPNAPFLYPLKTSENRIVLRIENE